MSIEKENVLDMPEGERYIRFCVAVQEHRKAGFLLDQKELDRIASMFNVTAPRLSEIKVEDDYDVTPSAKSHGQFDDEPS